MMRGVLGGLVAGGVVAVLGIASLSLMTPLPQSGQQAAPLAAGEPAAPAPIPAEPTAAPTDLAAPAPSAPAPAVATGAPSGTEGQMTGASADMAPSVAADQTAPPKAGGTMLAPVGDAASPSEQLRIATDPGARPETADPQAALAPALAVPGTAMETPPQSESPMPVPPPGEVVSPELAPATSTDDARDLPHVFTLDGTQGGGAALSADSSVVTNRLPRIGDAAPEAAPAAPETQVAPTEEPAFRRYAQGFIAPPGVPLISVILVDTGLDAGGLDRNTLKMLDFPVTIAIDPNRADAREAAADYRSRGLGVAILATGLPEGASPADLEVAVEAWRAAIPEAVAVVEPPMPLIQNNRKLSEQLVAILGRAGLGLVTQRQGLNPAGQLARAADIPTLEVWRVLDAEREPADVIERALTRAAFEAQRDGKVTIMLSAWPESVAGLSSWAGRIGQGVALAPVTALVTE